MKLLEDKIYARLLHEPYKGEESFLYSTSAESLLSHEEILEEYYEDTGINFDPREEHTEDELDDFEEFVDWWLEKNDYIGRYYFDPDEMKLIARDGVNAIEVDNIEEIPSFNYAVFTPKHEKQYAIVFFEGRELCLNINEDGTLVEPTNVLRVIDLTNEEIKKEMRWVINEV